MVGGRQKFPPFLVAAARSYTQNSNASHPSSPTFSRMMKASYSRVPPPWVIMQGQKPGFLTIWTLEPLSLRKGYGILTTEDPLCISSCCSEPPELSFWTLFFVLAADLAGSYHETFEVLGSNFMDVIRKQRVREARKKNTHIPKKKRFWTSKSIRWRGEFLEVFLVGCGALGCEYLKGLALMGLAAMLAACATLNTWGLWIRMKGIPPQNQAITLQNLGMHS